MPDAAGQYLDPTLGSTAPRPVGFEPGAFPLQADAARLLAWTLGATGRAISPPFGETVGEPLCYRYEIMTTWFAGVHCLGDPASPDDRSQVQAVMDNPPQPGRVADRWWWDWRRTTYTTQRWNQSLANRPSNPYLGHHSRAGDERPVLAVTTLTANGGLTLSNLTNLVLAAPGNATHPEVDCPLVADDGSAADPLPLRIPVWIGREGFRGETGQILAAGSTTQHLGSHLKIRPGPLTFADDLANLRLSLNAGAEYGGEGFVQLGYTMARLDGPFTFLRSDPNPPFTACVPHQDRLITALEQSAHVQVFATPLGDAWTVIISVQRVRQVRSFTGRYFVTFSNFSPIYYPELADLQQVGQAPIVQTQVLGLGSSSPLTIALWPEADLVVDLAVNATGSVTGEVRLVRKVSIPNLGAGWHDRLVRL